MGLFFNLVSMDRRERREYPACSLKERPAAAITVDKGFLQTITQEARVLPLFEERIHKYKYTKGYSLFNNEMLKCRWNEFMNTRKPVIPFEFPCVKDVHFVKGVVILEPKETVNNRANHRFHLRSGPGIDRFGQLPIPDDTQLRRTVYFKPRDKTNKNVVSNARRII